MCHKREWIDEPCFRSICWMLTSLYVWFPNFLYSHNPKNCFCNADFQTQQLVDKKVWFCRIRVLLRVEQEKPSAREGLKPLKVSCWKICGDVFKSNRCSKTHPTLGCSRTHRKSLKGEKSSGEDHRPSEHESVEDTLAVAEEERVEDTLAVAEKEQPDIWSKILIKRKRGIGRKT